MQPATKDIAEIVDLVIDEFMPKHCMSRNNLAVASAFMLVSTIMVKAHCQSTGDDFEETLKTVRDMAAVMTMTQRKKRPG